MRSARTVPRDAQQRPVDADDAVLRVTDLAVEFRTHRGWVRVVDDLSLQVLRGRIHGLVGESGSGKSVSCLAMMRLLPQGIARIAGGSVLLEGADLLTMDARQLRRVRGNDLAMIFQEPMTSLNPAFTIGEQIAEQLRLHRGLGRRAARRRAVELLDRVGIAAAAQRVRAYPYEFSGGMRQRVGIAMAISCDPKVLIADEPTTKLDVTVQAQVLELLKEMSVELGMGVLFVTHDLGVVADMCDQVTVMYAGQVAAVGPADAVFERPSHPYTEALLDAMPQSVLAGRGSPYVIPGAPPQPWAMPPGCRFAPRCRYAAPRCTREDPDLRPVDAQWTRCLRIEELTLRGVEAHG